MGRVRLVRATEDDAEAAVRGTHLYRVHVSRGREGVRVSCTCPRFETMLCKHVWATLVALDRRGEEEAIGVGRDSFPRPVPPPRAQPVALWQARLRGIASMDSAPARGEPGARWPAGREVLYEVDVAATLEGRGLVVGLFQRRRRKDGGWSRSQPLKAGRRLIETLPEAADREALALLLGGLRVDTYSYDPYDTTGPARFCLPGPLESRILADVCGTGRCVLRPANGREASPLSWDEGGAWRFEMSVKALGDRYVVDGVLRRGGEERPLDAPVLLTASGLVFMDGRAAPFEHGGAFAWVADLRRYRRLEVPSAEGERLRAALLATARRPPVELQAGLGLEEVRLAPVPHLRITAGDGGFRGLDELQAQPSFRYDEATVLAEAPGWAVPAADPSRVYVRDAPAEQARLDRLRALGVERSILAGREDGPLRVPKGRFGAVVSALTREGWHVEAEGRVYRRPATTSLRVSSGIDWFDLEARWISRGSVWPCPGSSQALRRGESSVVLGDGSRGPAPRGVAAPPRVARAVRRRPRRRHLRFRRNQAGPPRRAARRPARGRDRRGVRAGARRAAALRRGPSPDAPRAGSRGSCAATSARASAGSPSCASSASAAASPTTWASARRCRCWRCSRRAGAGKASGARRSSSCRGRSSSTGWRRRRASRRGLRVLDHTGLDRDGAASRASTATTSSSPPTARCGATSRRSQDVELRLRRPRRGAGDQERRDRVGQGGAAAARRPPPGAHAARRSRTTSASCGACFEFLNPGHARHGRGVRALASASAGEPDEEASRRCSRARSRPFILRRTKEQVAHDLPAEDRADARAASSSAEQRALYDELRDHYRAALLEPRRRAMGIGALEDPRARGAAAAAPGGLPPGPDRPARGAASRARSSTRCCRASRRSSTEGHKALVFSQFTSFLALVRDAARRRRDRLRVPRRPDARPRGARSTRFQDGPGLPALPDQPQGGRPRPQPDRGRLRLPARPLVEPGRRGAGDRPHAPHRPDAARSSPTASSPATRSRRRCSSSRRRSATWPTRSSGPTTASCAASAARTWSCCCPELGRCH